MPYLSFAKLLKVPSIGIIVLLSSFSVDAQTRKPAPQKTPQPIAKVVEPPKPVARPATIALTDGEPISGQFVDASPEGIHIMLAGNKMILKWSSVKQITFTDVMSLEAAPPPKVSKDKEAIANAIKVLRKLSSATEIGMNFPEYSRRLVDVKIEFDGLLADIPNGEARRELELAMSAFQDAKSAWNWMVGNNITGRPSGDLFVEAEPGKSLQPKYSLPTYDGGIKGLTFIEGDKAIRIIWAAARVHIDKVAANQ